MSRLENFPVPKFITNRQQQIPQEVLDWSSGSETPPERGPLTDSLRTLAGLFNNYPGQIEKTIIGKEKVDLLPAVSSYYGPVGNKRVAFFRHHHKTTEGDKYQTFSALITDPGDRDDKTRLSLDTKTGTARDIDNHEEASDAQSKLIEFAIGKQSDKLSDQRREITRRRKLKTRKAKRNAKRIGLPLLAVAGIYAGINGLADAAHEREQNRIAQTQKYDKNNYILPTADAKDQMKAIPSMAPRAFDQIPEKREDDNLAQPRRFKLSLNDRCSTFKVKNPTSKRIKLAVRQNDGYQKRAPIGILRGEDSIAICKTGYSRVINENDTNKNTAEMGVAIQLIDPSTDTDYTPIPK